MVAVHVAAKVSRLRSPCTIHEATHSKDKAKHITYDS